MKKYLQYWPYVAILIVAVCVWIFKPNPDRQLRLKYEKENKQYERNIRSAFKRIDNLQKDSIAMRDKMREQELQFQAEKKNDELRYNKLKKQHDKINFRNYNANQLDSIRRRLYPELYR